MADVSVPVGEQYVDVNGKKGPGGYGNGGAAAAGYAEPNRKAQRAHHCVNFILRLLTAMAAAAALTTMVKSNQTAPGATARWNDFAAFKWFVLANAIVLSYATLAALASLLGVFTRKGPLSSTPLAWLTFLLDFLLVNALMSATAAATTIAWIGRRGQLNAQWPSLCGVVGGFCRRVLGALIASYIAWVLLALSTILAAAAIHRLRRRGAVSY